MFCQKTSINIKKQKKVFKKRKTHAIFSMQRAKKEKNKQIKRISLEADETLCKMMFLCSNLTKFDVILFSNFPKFDVIPSVMPLLQEPLMYGGRNLMQNDVF